MLAQVNTRRRRARYRKACAGKPYFGSLLPVHLALFGRHSGCFFAGPSIAIDANGKNVLAAGSCDPAELASFLGVLGKHRILTDGLCPAGWRPDQRLHCYQLAAGAALPLPPRPPALALDSDPSPAAVASLLFAPGQRQTDFYAELCTKRNHGMARVWALTQNGRPVATVGAYALYDGEAYLACGETLPALRGQGIGGWLIPYAANLLAAEGWRVTFLARDERTAFYDRLGFARTDTLWDYTDLPPAAPCQPTTV